MRSRNRSAGETVEFFFSRNRVATLGLGDAFIEFRDLFRRKASETSALFRSFRKLLDQFAPLGRRECLEQFEDALSGFGHGLENSTKGASCEAAELLVLLVDSNSAAFVNGPKFQTDPLPIGVSSCGITHCVDTLVRPGGERRRHSLQV